MNYLSLSGDIRSQYLRSLTGLYVVPGGATNILLLILLGNDYLNFTHGDLPTVTFPNPNRHKRKKINFLT